MGDFFVRADKIFPPVRLDGISLTQGGKSYNYCKIHAQRAPIRTKLSGLTDQREIKTKENKLLLA